MAVIVSTGSGGPATAHKRTATAQATTGQTDWIVVPAYASFAYIDYNLTAVAGTGPTVDVSIKVPDLTTLDDTTGVVNLAGYSTAAVTQITGAARHLYSIGPGVAGIADDVTAAATGLSQISIGTVLPQVLGVKILNNRGGAVDQTYTYTLSVTFR